MWFTATVAVAVVGVLPLVASAADVHDQAFWEGITGWTAGFDMAPVPILSEDGELLVYQFYLATESVDDLEERVAELEATTAEIWDGRISIVRWPDGMHLWQDRTVVAVARFPNRSVVELLDNPRFQYTQIGVDLSFPPYENPDDPGPNPGNNFSLDVYNGPNGPEIGLTFWDGSQHIFGSYGTAFALANDEQIALVYPELAFSLIQDPSIWVQTPEGWVTAALGPATSTLYVGSEEFVANNGGTISADEAEEEEPAAEQPQEDDPIPDAEQDSGAVEEEPQTAPGASSDEVDEQLAAESASSDEGSGFPWFWGLAVLLAIVIGGGMGARAWSRRTAEAAAGSGAVAGEAATKPAQSVAPVSADGACAEEGAAYDKAYADWVVASRAMSSARDAYALGEDRGSDEARQAQDTAEAREQAAWKVERAAWDTYLNCVAGQREATQPRTRPVETPSQPLVPDSDANETTTADGSVGAVGTTRCVNLEVEWRRENAWTSWVEPAGTIDIYMDRTTGAFEDWLEEHGEVHDLTPSYLSWIGVPGAVVGWAHAAIRDDVSATLTLDDVQQLRSQSSSIHLFQTYQLKHWVTLWVEMPKKEYLRHCERKYICEDGVWRRTQETRLGEPELVHDVETERTEYECRTAIDVANAFERQFELVQQLEQDAIKKQDELRSRCPAG